jgi:hypothetical protein
MNAPLRHRCRNPHCRGKLPEPTENEHHAFCTRGCHARFYRSRCMVCEETMQRKDERQKLKSGHRLCQTEYRKFPRAYDFPTKMGSGTGFVGQPPGEAHFTGSAGADQSHPTISRCLRDWWWGGDGERDHSLYDRDGLTLARIVLVDGRYHLRTPIAIPRQSWPELEEAKRGAESFALMAMPLQLVDPKLAARIKKDNTTPHPMGAPRNREPSQETAIASGWKPAGSGADVPDVPEILRRAS